MKRVSWALALLLLLLGLGRAPAAYASENDIYQQQMEESGADELFGALPEETRALLQELGVSGISPDAAYQLSPTTLLQLIGHLIRQNAGEIWKTAALLFGILMLSALLRTVQPNSDGTESARVFYAAEILTCAILLLEPLGTAMEQASATLDGISAFQLGFVPVFAAITAASGQTVSAGKYAALMVAASQGSSVVLSGIIFPVMRISMALCVISAAAPGIALDGVIQWVRKCLNWLLGLLMTVFLAVLALQGTVGASADSLADKAAQFVIGTTVPVVGSALSQAYSSVRGYMQLLKSTVGAFGILATAVLVLPQLLRCVLWQLLLNGCGAAGELLAQPEPAGLFRRLAELMGVLTGVLLCGCLMGVVSVGVLLALRGGTG